MWKKRKKQQENTFPFSYFEFVSLNAIYTVAASGAVTSFDTDDDSISLKG